MDEAKIKEVFSDEEFIKSLFELETAQEVQSAVREKGIALSLEDIEAIRQHIVRGSDELSEEELDNVAGGLVASILAGTVIVCLVGLAGGAAIGGILGAGVTTAIFMRW